MGSNSRPRISNSRLLPSELYLGTILRSFYCVLCNFFFWSSYHRFI